MNGRNTTLDPKQLTIKFIKISQIPPQHQRPCRASYTLKGYLCQNLKPFQFNVSHTILKPAAGEIIAWLQVRCS